MDSNFVQLTKIVLIFARLAHGGCY